VAHFVGIETAKQASRDPLRSALYENLVILEVLKGRLNAGLSPSLFSYRDTNGNLSKGQATVLSLTCSSGADS
jgi:uncharacterized protein